MGCKMSKNFITKCMIRVVSFEYVYQMLRGWGCKQTIIVQISVLKLP
jgi:hypothetical protein